jgi:predicted ATPase
MATEVAGGRVHVQRLRLRNYRSVGECDIALQPGVTFLVGPNGAGKSNILDGLRFVSDSLNTSVDEAVQARGGFTELRHRRSRPDTPADVGIEIAFTSPSATGVYAVQLSPVGELYEVTAERCNIRARDGMEHSFDVSGGAVISTDPTVPRSDGSRPYLAAAATLPAFRPTFEALRRMSFYNLNPGVLREPQRRATAGRLARDGSNLASMLRLLGELAPDQKKIVEEYLAVVVPGTIGVEAQAVLGTTLESLAFRQQAGDGPAEVFYPQSMSDGTLRTLGVLVAIFQYNADADTVGVPLIGIEEPEVALHARATAVLRDALEEGGEHRQILVTTHSPELLDDREIDPDSVLAVEAIDGASVVGPPEPVGLGMMREGLFTAGGLLRANQLSPATGLA